MAPVGVRSARPCVDAQSHAFTDSLLIETVEHVDGRVGALEELILGGIIRREVEHLPATLSKFFNDSHLPLEACCVGGQKCVIQQETSWLLNEY